MSSNYAEEIRKRQSSTPNAIAANIANTLSSVRAETETAAAPEISKTEPKIRRGVQFREEDLELMADMLYACRKSRIKLSGKLGPSLVLHAALEHFAEIYREDRVQFLEIMRRYAKGRIGV